ncbi:hypothetical protein VNO77_03613 [Canavalia gladiata]|uniref:Uncharacterized protein n=1 Tax=Canavalia gladiata TaxID=3824 RepID=A0AAN9MV66_CANGL
MRNSGVKLQHSGTRFLSDIPPPSGSASLKSSLLPKASSNPFIKLILTLIGISLAFSKLHATQKVQLANDSSGADPNVTSLQVSAKAAFIREGAEAIRTSYGPRSHLKISVTGIQ